MTVKQTIHPWVEALSDNTPELLALYELVRLNLGLMDAMRSAERGDVRTGDEIRMRFALSC